ncbi:MAG: DUF2975 domain-containing protein [Pseudomonadota bacterium]
MNVRSQRLARGLSHILVALLALCAIGLVILLPTMIFAYLAPGALPAELSTKVNGVAVDVRQPMVAGTLLLYANVALAAMTTIVVALRRIMQTVVAADPFDVRNIGRLRLIAWAMAALVAFEALGSLLAPPAVRAQLGLEHGGFNFGMFIGMLVVLVLAEVFREGARLREENEGTI